jgi:hypothetical protein
MLNFDNRHYYDILKVGNHATRKEITASYSRLVKEHNPDGKSFSSQSLKHKAQVKFKLINKAYQTLSNPIKRVEYDAFLDDPIHDEADVDTKTKEESCDDETNKIIINCPKCDQRLRVLYGKSLSVTCSSCSHTFDFQEKYQECQPEDSRETPKTQPEDTKAETPTSEKQDSSSQPYENRKKLNYFQKHWRGELSLALSFWVNFCLINIIIMSLVNWFVQNSPIDHPVISARIAIIIVIFSLFIYAWQLVGLWRSTNRHVVLGGKASWAHAAQVIVILCIISNLINIATHWGAYKDTYKLGFQKDSTSAYSLTLRRNNSLIHLEGGLRFGVSKDVAALLNDHPDIKGIILDSIGGRVYEGRELSKLILIYGLDTYSLKGCYSAGTIAFISGTNRFLGTGANLGFHQYSMDYEQLSEFANLEGEQEEDLRIFKRKDIKKEFLEKLYDTTAEDLWYPSIDELLSSGVIHGLVNHSDLTPVEYSEDIKSIDIKKVFLNKPLYRAIQKYEPDVFEQMMIIMDEQIKKGATALEIRGTLANNISVLAFRIMPKSGDNSLVRFYQLFIKSLKKLVETDPILGLKYLYPEQYGRFAFSEYFSNEELAQGDDIFNDIIIEAYENESPQVDIEAAEPLIQSIITQLGDYANYVDIDLKELQNSDQYKLHCDALIRFYEIILARDNKAAANILRYSLTQDESDEDVYVGDIVDGKMDGYGTYTLDGNKYTGEFKNDKVEGQGTLVMANGDKYVGEFKNNERAGQGTLVFANGDKYVGEFKNNERTGQGTFVFANDDKYVGEWKNTMMHGYGTFTYSDGAKYVGGFKNNKFEGHGKHTWLSGDKYVGEWKNDMRNGQGTQKWFDGGKYVGEWKADLMHGQGTYILSKDEKYVGKFEDNKATGGWYYWVDGNRNWAYTDAQGNWKFQDEGDSEVGKSDNLKSKDTEINNITPDMQFVQQRLGEPHSIENDSTTERWYYNSSYIEFKEGIFFRCYEPHGNGVLHKKLNHK